MVSLDHALKPRSSAKDLGFLFSSLHFRFSFHVVLFSFLGLHFLFVFFIVDQVFNTTSKGGSYSRERRKQWVEGCFLWIGFVREIASNRIVSHTKTTSQFIFRYVICCEILFNFQFCHDAPDGRYKPRLA